MKLYKTTITPESSFATPLKGDTLFGQMCWAIRYSFGNDKLKNLLENYKNDKKPFLVVSDGFAQGFLPKPKMPGELLSEKSEDKKENRKKIWLTISELINGEYQNARTDEEIKHKEKVHSQMHNSINYKYFHTTEGFDPYGVELFSIPKKDIYFLIDEEQFNKEMLEKSFEMLKKIGYGKDTTVGLGRFDFEPFEEIVFKQNSKTVMTLSPFFPDEKEYEKFFYEPFIRFGKMGGNRATTNAFKKPLLLADTGSVIKMTDRFEKNYIGRAILDVSLIYKDTVHQGYAITVPIKDIS